MLMLSGVFAAATMHYMIAKIVDSLIFDPDKCSDCSKCENVCPMDIKLLEYKNNNRQILSTECIWCSLKAVCRTDLPERFLPYSALFF